MEHSLYDIFSNGSYILLAGLVAASLFFAMSGLRELSSHALEGLLFLALAMFFFCLHLFGLFNLPSVSSIIHSTGDLNCWRWIVSFLAPVLIGLFILMGIFSFFTSRYRPGMVKIFFGLTLLCFLYMLGVEWSVDTKSILSVWYGGIWFNLELRTS